MQANCKSCGESFEISDGEIEFYKKKNLDLPKRCKKCRENSKRSKGAAAYRGSARKNNGQAKPYNQAHTASKENTTTQKTSHKRRQPSKFAVAVAIIAIIFCAVTAIGSFIDGLSDDNSAGTDTLTNSNSTNSVTYNFRTTEDLTEHYYKHGAETGDSSAEAYLAGANEVIQNPNALSKNQSDGDTAYFLESTGEFAVLAPDGVIRTYFIPDDGIEYFNRQ